MQSDINLKDYEFENGLLKNVWLFNEVLNELNEPPIFENKNFAIVGDFKIFPTYLVMETKDNLKNTLPLTIWFEGDDLRIDVNGIPETFDWAKKHIEEDKNAVIKLIEQLFTGYVLIDYRGSTKFVQMFDAQGNFIKSFSRNNLFHMITGRYIFHYKDYRKLFLPIFSKK